MYYTAACFCFYQKPSSSIYKILLEMMPIHKTTIFPWVVEISMSQYFCVVGAETRIKTINHHLKCITLRHVSAFIKNLHQAYIKYL
jgi:hypothetical protein